MTPGYIRPARSKWQQISRTNELSRMTYSGEGEEELQERRKRSQGHRPLHPQTNLQERIPYAKGDGLEVYIIYQDRDETNAHAKKMVKKSEVRVSDCARWGGLVER